MGGKKAILLAEDQADQREMLKLLLEGSGYDVTTAPDGARTLQLLKRHQFDLVILDIMMPKIDGVTICNKLKHVRSRMRTPVCIISALGRNSQASEIEWLDRTLADAFIAKPFDLRDFLSVVARLLHEPITEAAAREKAARQAHFRDIKDLVQSKDPTARAQLRPTKQEVSTHYLHKHRFGGPKNSK